MTTDIPDRIRHLYTLHNYMTLDNGVFKNLLEVQHLPYLATESGIDMGYTDFGWYLDGPYSKKCGRDAAKIATMLNSGHGLTNDKRFIKKHKNFLDSIQRIYRRNSDLIPTMSQALYIRQDFQYRKTKEDKVDQFIVSDLYSMLRIKPELTYQSIYRLRDIGLLPKIKQVIGRQR